LKFAIRSRPAATSGKSGTTSIRPTRTPPTGNYGDALEPDILRIVRVMHSARDISVDAFDD
jgi:hypothetical protein